MYTEGKRKREGQRFRTYMLANWIKAQDDKAYKEEVQSVVDKAGTNGRWPEESLF
jgi:hypothetical protein